MIRILIVDDHPIVRAGLRAVFEAEPDFDVVGEEEKALAAVDRAKAGGIDLITMDLRFPSGESGVVAVERIQTLDDPPAVLVLTNYDNDSEILRAVAAGARGYLLKDAPADTLVRAVRDAVAGRPVLAPVVASKLMRRLRSPSLQLTGREHDVLACLDRGLSNHDIGAELNLSKATVKSHLARLYSKLGVSSRTAALAKAREHGLLE